jgi:hypothetical protein
MGENRVAPALLYRMSMPPCAVAAVSIQALTPSSSFRSSGWVLSIAPPRARTSVTVSAAPPALMSVPATVAPSAANSSAAARPCPLAVPVISATFPARRPVTGAPRR